MRKRLDVTELDIMAELDQLRQKPDRRAAMYSPEQDAVLWHARGPHQDAKVRWTDLRRLWFDRWGHVPAKDTLLQRLRDLEAQGGPQVVNGKTSQGG